MVVKDQLYGEYKIDSEVIKELVRSKPLQRLKKIAQYGIPAEFYHLVSFSRFDHSVGTMLLLKKFGASEEEQIAGLLHDVSHTAFSHLVDWFVGSGATEDFQDRQHKEFIEKSDVSRILKKHKLSPKRISEHENFSLLEQPIPRLCADRLDYALKEFPREIARKCLNGLIVYKGRFAFKTEESAFLFGKYFLKQQKEHWGGDEAVVRYTILAKTIKHAMKRGIISFKDFWEYDEFILGKLRKADDDFIQGNLRTLRKRSLKNFPRGSKILKKKFRYVDPDVIINDHITRLSTISGRFRSQIEAAKIQNKKGIKIPRL